MTQQFLPDGEEEVIGGLVNSRHSQLSSDSEQFHHSIVKEEQLPQSNPLTNKEERVSVIVFLLIYDNMLLIYFD